MAREASFRQWRADLPDDEILQITDRQTSSRLFVAHGDVEALLACDNERNAVEAHV
jgi:hypothetical protein